MSQEVSRLSGESKVNHSHEVNIEEYLKVVEDLKASENVILELKGIITEYQQLIDEQDEQREENNNTSSEYESVLKEKILEYEELINSKIEYIDDLALKNRDLGPAQGLIDKLIRKLHREKAKRQVLEERVLKLGESLIDYEKEIMEKTEKISYLNFLLLDLQDKSEMNITY